MSRAGRDMRGRGAQVLVEADALADVRVQLGRMNARQAAERNRIAESGYIIDRCATTLSTGGATIAIFDVQRAREWDYWLAYLAISPSLPFTTITSQPFLVFSGNPPYKPGQTIDLGALNAGDFRDVPATNQLPARVDYSKETFFIPPMDHLYVIFSTAAAATPVELTACIGRRPWGSASREELVGIEPADTH